MKSAEKRNTGEKESKESTLDRVSGVRGKAEKNTQSKDGREVHREKQELNNFNWRPWLKQGFVF